VSEANLVKGWDPDGFAGRAGNGDVSPVTGLLLDSWAIRTYTRHVAR
jgi:hypothetical protein